MRVEVFYYEPLRILLDSVNVSWTEPLTGHAVKLRKAFDRDLDLDSDQDERRCDEVYSRLGNNAADSKPDRFLDRTMSVGDLVRFDSDTGRVYQTMTVGFARVPAEVLSEHCVELDSVPAIDFPTWHAEHH